MEVDGSLVWDATVVGKLAMRYRQAMAETADTEAEYRTTEGIKNIIIYLTLVDTHDFIPMVLEAIGLTDCTYLPFIADVGRHYVIEWVGRPSSL